MILEYVAYYCLSSVLVMSLKVHWEADDFFARQLNIAQKKLDELKQKLSERKISPLVYKNEQERYSSKLTIRTTLWVNYLLSPVLSPLILLTFIFRILADTILLIKYRR